jgi:hypothetical protein
MYQEAIEQSAKQLGLEDYYAPNPEMERIDAALSAESENYDSDHLTGLLAKDDTPEDIKYSNYNNAITFMEPKELEHLFELHQPLSQSQALAQGQFSRSYHPGRIYGNGEYGDPKRERDYQAFIHNTDLVLLTKLLASVSTEPIPNNLRFDDLQSE